MSNEKNYQPPETVLSPQQRIGKDTLKVLFDGGEEGVEAGFSVAELLWDGQKVLAIRWNGSKNNKDISPLGYPNAFGQYPSWFILPEVFNSHILAEVLEYQKLHDKIKKLEESHQALQAKLEELKSQSR